MDGANVEICEEAGAENEYIFGATVDEVATIKRFYWPLEIIGQNPALKRALDTMIDGTFSDEAGSLKKLHESLTAGHTPDRYLVLLDFADYVRVKEELLRDYGTEEFWTKCLLNTSAAGKFSADRAVSEYAKLIWHIK